MHLILDGHGYDEDGELHKDILTKRQDREDFLDKDMYIYVYFIHMDLMNAKENLLNYATIASLYFPVKRCGHRNCRYRNKRNHRQSRNSALEFIEFFNNELSSNLSYSVLEIRKYLDNCKKKTLKRIALLCRDKPPEIKYNPKFEQWYSYALDIIDTKTFKPSHVDNYKTKICPKNVFIVTLHDKGMEQINLNRILKSKVLVHACQEKYSYKKI